MHMSPRQTSTMLTMKYYILCIAVLFGCTNGKCLWKSDDSISYHRRADGMWERFGNSLTFHHVQTVEPGDNAVVLQQHQYHPVVLDNNSAYYNGMKFASGHWVNSNEWRGHRSGGGSARYVKEGNEWVAYRNNVYRKTFRHIQRIDASTTAVLLQHEGDWTNVLTDTSAYYNGVQELSGNWIPTCNWYGRRNDSQTAEFKWISPTTWYEYDNGHLIDTYQHRHIIQPGDEAIVLQVSNSCDKSVILDYSHAYYNNEVFANGHWSSHDVWTGTRSSGGRTQFTRRGSTWRETGENRKILQHVQSIPSDQSAVVIQQDCLWPLVLGDNVATKNGETFASGVWREVTDPETGEDVVRNRRAIRDAIVREISHDRGNCRRVNLRERDGHAMVTEPLTRLERSQASSAIGRFQQEYLGYRQRSEVVLVGTHTNGVRIDIQGRFTDGGQLFANVQVQTNGAGRSRTLAQASIPVNAVNAGNVTLRNVRAALVRSLEQSSLVTLECVAYTRGNRPWSHDELY